MDTLPQINIHLARPGKTTRLFTEGLVEDNGACLKTFSAVPRHVAPALSGTFQDEGLIAAGREIAFVRKYHFYKEYFSILELREEDGTLLGYYCDIATPLTRSEDGYFLTDLFLDVWLFPDLSCRVLDQDEFDAAIRAGLVTQHQAAAARQTIERIQSEAARGDFPHLYMR